MWCRLLAIFVTYTRPAAAACFPSVLPTTQHLLPPRQRVHTNQITSKAPDNMQAAPADIYKVISTELNNFKAATSNQNTKVDTTKLTKAISKLNTTGIFLKQSRGKWAALIGEPKGFSWGDETCHIDQVRISFAGPSRPLNRVFLSDPQVVLPPGQDYRAPDGSWEFFTKGLCFTPSSVDCTRLECAEYSASATLTPTMLLQGGKMSEAWCSLSSFALS